LALGGELCVCDLAWISGYAENLASHHLRRLREAGLAGRRRRACPPAASRSALGVGRERMARGRDQLLPTGRLHRGRIDPHLGRLASPRRELGWDWPGPCDRADDAPAGARQAQRRHQLGSAATVSEGSQNLVCAYLSLALLVGLGANALVGWWWADPLAALVIAGVAAREGINGWNGDGCGDGCC